MIIITNLLWYHWLIIGLGIFILVSLLFGVWITFETARRVYLHTLSTKMGGDWKRVCSAPNNPEQVKMWDDGISYMSQFEDKKHELQITNDGLKLCGEFFDFGHKKTALFLCGRCECALYAYFYAKPYIESGYNVLFIDPRAHGFSDGQFSTVGIKESEDAIQWMKHVAKEFKQEKFVLHCVCVGGAAGLLAASNKNNDNLVEKVVVDGLFTNFKESYKRHYCDLGHKVFPVFYQIWFWFRIYTGVSVKQSNPEKIIKNFELPILFLHTKLDKFSLPDNAIKMFNDCPSKQKQFVFFESGSHSHIRNNETEKYDRAIKDFLTTK